MNECVLNITPFFRRASVDTQHTPCLQVLILDPINTITRNTAVEIQALWSQNYDTETLHIVVQFSIVDNAIPFHRAGYDRHNTYTHASNPDSLNSDIETCTILPMSYHFDPNYSYHLYINIKYKYSLYLRTNWYISSKKNPIILV